jgi:hypothetical protein
MIHKTIAIPEQDLGLFLALIKRFRWKEEIPTSPQTIPTWHKAVIDKTLKNLQDNSQSAKPWEQLKQALDNENV